MPGRRSVPWAVALAFGFVVLAPVAAAQAVDVRSVTLDLATDIDVSRMVLEPETVPPNGPTSTCNGGELAADPATRAVNFTESFRETGCGQARLEIMVPLQAVVLEVTFEANRDVSEQTTLEQPKALAQELVLLAANSEVIRSVPYINRTLGDQELRTFSFSFLLPPATDRLSLDWFWADLGHTAALEDVSPGSLQVFESVLRNITLAWPAIPLPMPAVVVGEEQVDDEADLITTPLHVDLLVPPEAAAPSAHSTLAILLGGTPEVLGIDGPLGPLPSDGYAVTTTNGTTLVELTNGSLSQPGSFRLRMQTVAVIPPAPPASPPATIAPLFYTLVFLPLAGVVLAVVGATAFRREAEGRYLRGARVLLVIVALLVLYYAFLLFYAFVNVGRVRMWTLPLEAVANLLYVQFVVVLLVLILLALGISRYGLSSMRRSLDERRAQQERLRQSNEELERFAYVASHDLQEPLRKVAGFTALLQKRYKGRLDKDADEMIDYAVDGATRMQALIRDILAYSRVNSTELEMQVVDLGALMDLVVNDLDGIIRKNRASVTWKGLPTVRADPTQIRQVLQNLVENGLKYRHPKRKPRITVSAERYGAGWAIRVADNGVGIPADKQEEVFGIFRRLHGRDVPGTGIGLAIVRKAIERHGGTVHVESAPSRGSVFMFTLPHG